jgi:hypothetical protein
MQSLNPSRNVRLRLRQTLLLRLLANRCQILQQFSPTASQVMHLQQLNTLASVRFEPTNRRSVQAIYMREIYFNVLKFGFSGSNTATVSNRGEKLGTRPLQNQTPIIRSVLKGCIIISLRTMIRQKETSVKTTLKAVYKVWDLHITYIFCFPVS